MPQRLLIAIAWLAILALGFALRVNDLSSRPMHADEATGARILAERLEKGTYAFNPKHFHGPTLSLLSVPIANWQNESKWSELSKQSLRWSPLVAGSLLILIPLFWRKQMGATGALIAAALIATSPLLVYYSRMYIHESWLVLFTLLALTTLYKWADRPSLCVSILAGLCIGLMHATKETFAISMIAWLCALGAIYLISQQRPPINRYLIPFTSVTVSAILISAILYSNGFRNLNAIIDAVTTYFSYETTGGHEKPFTHYFYQMLWPKNSLGTWWTEAGVALIAFIAVIQKPFAKPVLFLAIATITHFLIYSLIDYKTPWLMLVPWAHLCLLAGYSFKTSSPLPIKIALACLVFLSLGFQTQQSLLASGRFENDPRNPYAYVPSSKNLETLGPWLSEITDAQQTTIAVVGREYWPLPWYLREFENVGYWPEMQPELIEQDLLFLTADQENAHGESLKATHTAMPRSLRENVAIYLYLSNEIWDRWNQKDQ